MHGYIPREVGNVVRSRLATSPSVALLGARQVGKSTLARALAREHPGKVVFLDLESAPDRARLSDPAAYFASLDHTTLTCLDEIQRMPELFTALRVAIDRGDRFGQFLILGSASRDLIQQSAETLAGRISYLEIGPFSVRELTEPARSLHWVRGGYPRSILAPSEAASVQWREDYVKTFLERDVPQLGFAIPAESMRRLWTMLAHSQGSTLNSAKLAGSLGVSAHTVRRYIDILEQTFLVRSLPAYHANLKKRLVKAPKVYIRDTGLLHTLLGLDTKDALLGHPVYGASWETYALENILSKPTSARWQASFIRTTHGAEIDLILERAGRRIVVECKANSAPKVSRGFHGLCEALEVDAAFVVAPVGDSFPLPRGVTACSPGEFWGAAERWIED